MNVKSQTSALKDPSASTHQEAITAHVHLDSNTTKNEGDAKKIFPFQQR
jgi:hypothetical protein